MILLTEDLQARIKATDAAMRAFHARNIAAQKAKFANADLERAEAELTTAIKALAALDAKTKEST
jgi:hypothetical protein